jgi:hypothetical protein
VGTHIWIDDVDDFQIVTEVEWDDSSKAFEITVTDTTEILWQHNGVDMTRDEIIASMTEAGWYLDE